MSSHPRLRTSTVLVLVLLAALCGGAAAGLVHQGPVQPARPAPVLGLQFVPNHGQWPDAVRYFADGGPMAFWLEHDGWVFTLEQPAPVARGPVSAPGSGVAVRMRWMGTSRDARLVTDGQLAGVRNYLLGDEPAAWVTGVPAYGSVVYAGLYAGIDLVARRHGRQLEYDLLVAPGADVSEAMARCEGADALSLDAEGALLIHTALGVVRQPAPTTWQLAADGTRQPVLCTYELRGGMRFGFRVPELDPTRPLVIDPVLEWASYLGGTSNDQAHEVLVDGSGEMTLVGFTSPSSYPLTMGAYDTTLNGQRDGVITRLSSDGQSLVFSTVLGGGGDDEVLDVALDQSGGIVLTGWTNSGNFPTSANAYDQDYQQGGVLLSSDVFVACLDEHGGQLLLSTFLGGAGDDIGYAVAVSDAGDVYVAGKTASPDFPVTAAAFDTGFNGGSPVVGDGFVLRVSPDGTQLAASTYLGGQGDDLINDMVVRADGLLTVTGWTSSSDFPTTSGNSTLSGTSDAFVASLDGSTATLQRSMLLGGSADENVLALGTDQQDRLLLAGTTRSANAPVTAGAPQPTYAGGGWYGDAWLLRLAAGDGTLDFATYLGGSGDEMPTGVEAFGDLIVLSGWTTSADLPASASAWDTTLGGSRDGMLAVIDPATGALQTLSYLGGSSNDKILGLGLTLTGRVIVAGSTTSLDFPVTPGAYDPGFDGLAGLISDSFVAQLDLDLGAPPSGDWNDMGFGLEGMLGTPELSAVGALTEGESGALVLSGARPNALVIVMVGLEDGYHPVQGGTLVPWPVVDVLHFGTDGLGLFTLPYQTPVGLEPGLAVYVHAWVEDPAAVEGYAASNALKGVVR